MLHAVLQISLYGALAGASPTAFAATITVTHSGRAKALAFAIGFVSAQLATCSLLVAIDIEVGGRRNHHPGIQFVLEAAVAVTLVWLAVRARRRDPAAREPGTRRTHRLLERLDRLHLLTAATAGLVLGIGVPKRLGLAVLAAATINTAGVRPSMQAFLTAIYVAVATAVVWVPVLLLVLFGDRAIALMKRSEDEFIRRQPGVTIHALQLLAALFALDAARVLVTEIL